MTVNQSRKLGTIDKLIFGFVLLFIISLTNSIFVNQIGYFFALFLFVYRYAVTRENKFEKNGLELVFILFLSAELISAIFSIDHAVAFKNFFKRLILIPIVYTVAASAEDSDKAKLLFKVYIGAALVTLLVYIVFAYEHFIAQLYRLESKGPSPFQYVMTAGGLMSFTVIFFFALLVNEKTKLSIRLFYLIAFGVSAIGLFASYTRAAWVGAVAGIIMVIIFKRKWIVIIPLAVLLIFAFIFLKSESKVYKYELRNNNFVQSDIMNTNGRATGITASGDTLFIADYENGVIISQNGKEIEQIKTPSPVTVVDKWRKNFLVAYLVDSRILLIEKTSSGKFYVKNSFTSPGQTTETKIANGNFYVSDEDSGLTIFKNPLNLLEKITFRKMSGINSFDCDSLHFASFTAKDHIIRLYANRNGIPVSVVDSFDTKSYLGFIWLKNDRVFFQGAQEFVQFVISGDKLRKVGSQKVQGVFRVEADKENIYACTVDGKIFLSNEGFVHINEFKQVGSLGFSPLDFIKEGETFYASFNKRNRLASVYDPYHETNIERMNIWRTGFKIFADYPLFGIGDIDLGKIYGQYKEKYLKENFGHMHNNYVHFLVILGAVGFLAAMFMLFKIFLLHLKIYRTVKDVPFVSSFALGAAASFVGFLFSGLGEWNFGDQEIITMIWFILGLNIAFYKSHLKNIEGKSTQNV